MDLRKAMPLNVGVAFFFLLIFYNRMIMDFTLKK